jgi:hypothetical protein
MQAFGTLLVGIAAIAALVFTWQSSRATNGQLQATEQGQITDRYTAAITDLGSQSIDVRLGGIYALQRIMQDSPRDQPTVVAVLCAFVRDHANALVIHSGPTPPPTDIQAAVTVVGTRDAANDGSATVVDLTFAQLTSVDLGGMDLAGANFTGADLTDANFTGANLADANLTNVHLGTANLTNAHLGSATLHGAFLGSANFTGAYLVKADLTHTYLVNAILTGANLTGVNFSGAKLTGAKGLSTGTP